MRYSTSLPPALCSVITVLDDRGAPGADRVRDEGADNGAPGVGSVPDGGGEGAGEGDPFLLRPHVLSVLRMCCLRGEFGQATKATLF
eukprot:gene11151-biopygen19859